MAEAIFKDSFPALKELESKVGRKTPESLLVWMRDAADCDGCWGSDVVDRTEHHSALGDGISAKLSNLKREMQWLRSADVGILCQLVAVHEGIEAMRWLMEDRGALASQSSSLTDSLSSLGTVEEPGPRSSPCSERVSPTCPQDLTKTTEEESEDRQPPHTYDCDSDYKSYFNVLSLQSTGARPPGLSISNNEIICSTHGKHARALTSDSLQKSQPLDMGSLQACKSGANTIKRALLRSNRVRRELNVDTTFSLPKQSGETQTEHQTQERFKASHNNTVKDDKSIPNTEKLLPGYDALWCWVESQDDVTFL